MTKTMLTGLVKPQSTNRGREEIEGVYLPSQLECTLQLCHDEMYARDRPLPLWADIQRRGSILACIVILSVYDADTIAIDLSLSALIS